MFRIFLHTRVGWAIWVFIYLTVASIAQDGTVNLGHQSKPILVNEKVPKLWGVRWTADHELHLLEDLKVRYAAARIALIDGDKHTVEELQVRGLEIVFEDYADEGEEYFLSDHMEWPLVDGLTLIYHDKSGWALVRLARENLAAIQEVQHFLWPLPEQYVLDGWLAKPAAKLGKMQQVEVIEDLLELVDIKREQQDLAILALKDPELASTADNLRSRYARRQETFESTQFLQGQLAAILGPEAVRLESFQIDLDEPEMYNVIGELPGSDPEAGYYVICAHYDAVGTRTRGGWNWRTDPAPGADDNASGVVLVLESARVLAQRRFPWGIRFIAFSGEELGLWGSKHHAKAVAERDERILGVLNFDMIGFNDLSDRLELVTNRASRWLVDEMITANERYSIGLRIDVLEDEYARLSDHAPFWANGYDAILGIENYLPTDGETAAVKNDLYRLNTQYHTTVDLPDSINWELVGKVTRLAVATLGQYGLVDGLPNLAVHASDIRGNAQDDLQVQISNLGLGEVNEPYAVKVSRCQLDSSNCEVIFETTATKTLAVGGVENFTVPWQRFGDMVFRIEVDPEDQLRESKEDDNLLIERKRLVPQAGIVVFPNPFQPIQNGSLFFSGIPLHASVQITTLNGNVVWSAQEDVGEQRNRYTREIEWTGVNQVQDLDGNLFKGALVGSGVYIYTVTDINGKILKRDKIAVVR